MSSSDLLERIKQYLDARFKNDKYYKEYHFRPYEIIRNIPHTTLNETEVRWFVSTPGMLGCSQVVEDEKGRIWVVSGITHYPKDALLEEYDVTDFETEDRIVDDLSNRNWEKYVEKYTSVVGELAWLDEVASRLTKETGVQVVNWIPGSQTPEDRTYFYSIFDSTGMSDDEKMNEIERGVNVIDKAYKMSENFEAEKEFWRQRYGEGFAKKVFADRRKAFWRAKRAQNNTKR